MQPTRQTVAEDLPNVVAFLRPLVATMGSATLAEVVALLELAGDNEAALGLVANAVLSAVAPEGPGRQRRA